MGMLIYPTVPVAQPAAEPWPADDEFSIRLDETFARRLDTEFAGDVRTLLHGPDSGLSSLKGEAALEAIAGTLPTLEALKERTLDKALGPRQRALLTPLIDTRLDWAAGAIGRLAERASVEVDDQSVAERVAGLQGDAAAAWDDPAQLRRLGRAAVSELRYQGERRGWDPVETEAKARAGLSDLYAGAVEAAIGADIKGAARLYDHTRDAIAPERQVALDRDFAAARENTLLQGVDAALAAMPLDPVTPPDAGSFTARVAELTPDDASPDTRARLADVAAHARRRADRQWQKAQAEAGVAAFDWLKANPDAPPAVLPPDVRDWLAPDQQRGLAVAAETGRVQTDPELRERLDRLAVYEPRTFAGIDLSRFRLTLEDRDYGRFLEIRNAVIEGRIDPGHVRYARLRVGVDRALDAAGVDTEGPEAIAARVEARDRLDSFEAIEGRPPGGTDLDAITRRTVEPLIEAGAKPREDEALPADATGSGGPVGDIASATDDNASLTLGVEAAGAPAPDPGSAEDVAAPPFADDPNIIRVGGGSNSSRRGGGGRPLTPIEEMRAANFQSTLNAIRELEPNNPRSRMPRREDGSQTNEMSRVLKRSSAASGKGLRRPALHRRSTGRHLTRTHHRGRLGIWIPGNTRPLPICWSIG